MGRQAGRQGSRLAGIKTGRQAGKARGWRASRQAGRQARLEAGGHQDRQACLWAGHAFHTCGDVLAHIVLRGGVAGAVRVARAQLASISVNGQPGTGRAAWAWPWSGNNCHGQAQHTAAGQATS